MRYRNLYAIAVFVFTTFIISLQSCKSGNEPDVSSVQVDLTIKRLDKDLFALDTNHLATGLVDLKKKYPEFLDFYLDTLMGYSVYGNYSDTSIGVQKGLHTLLTYPDFRGLFDTIAVHFPDMDKTNESLKKGYQYLKYYYPSQPVPEIVYLNSNLNNYAAFTYDTIAIGIGLDMYLGEGYPFYKSVGIPDYVTRKLTPAYIVPNVFISVYRANHPFFIEGKTLLDMMVQRGKEQYFLSKIIPFVPEYVRLGFTEKQLEWCENSEAAVYNFFVNKQFLYSTNLQQVYRYVTDGPNAAGMPVESPGNIGSWLGYQIIKAYAEKYPKVSLQNILEIKDAQKILQQSRYNPK